MTAPFSAATFQMPHRAFAMAAPAPLAQGAAAEPCAPAKPADERKGLELGGITRSIRGLRGGNGSSDRVIGGSSRPSGVDTWYGQDQAQLAGGSPLRA